MIIVGSLITPEEVQAIWLSMKVSLTAVLVSLPLGLALAWILARREFRGKSLVETAVSLPLVLPPVVTGYLLLVAFGRHGWLGRSLHEWLGMEVVFTWKGAAIASAVVSFPLMVRAMRIAFTSVDPRLEQTARTLGAGRLDTFLTVSLPLARHGVIAGCVLAFARSMGEFGATVMIAGNIPGQTQTIPLFIYSLVQSPGGADRAWRIVVISVLIAALALMAGEWMERRGRTAAAQVKSA